MFTMWKICTHMKCEVKHNGNIEMGPLWLNGWGLWLNRWGIYGLMMYMLSITWFIHGLQNTGVCSHILHFRHDDDLNIQSKCLTKIFLISGNRTFLQIIHSSLLYVQRQKFVQKVKDTAATQNTSTSVGKLMTSSIYKRVHLCLMVSTVSRSIKTPCSSSSAIVIFIALHFCMLFVTSQINITAKTTDVCMFWSNWGEYQWDPH